MTETPGAVVSLRCPDCDGRGDQACRRCHGEGIVMLRVAAHEVTLSSEELQKRALRPR